ncbi:MAG: hypothetical protein ACTSU2_12000 [Promethearchaeota archaeon]
MKFRNKKKIIAITIYVLILISFVGAYFRKYFGPPIYDIDEERYIFNEEDNITLVYALSLIGFKFGNYTSPHYSFYTNDTEYKLNFDEPSLLIINFQLNKSFNTSTDRIFDATYCLSIKMNDSNYDFNITQHYYFNATDYFIYNRTQKGNIGNKICYSFLVQKERPKNLSQQVLLYQDDNGPVYGKASMGVGDDYEGIIINRKEGYVFYEVDAGTLNLPYYFDRKTKICLNPSEIWSQVFITKIFEPFNLSIFGNSQTTIASLSIPLEAFDSNTAFEIYMYYHFLDPAFKIFIVVSIISFTGLYIYKKEQDGSLRRRILRLKQKMRKRKMQKRLRKNRSYYK